MEEKIIIIISLFINFFIFFNFKKISELLNMYDYPDSDRKFHKKATPILGGFIFYFSILFLFFFQTLSSTIIEEHYLFKNINFFMFLSVFFFIYIYDDKKVLSPNFKLFSQILIILTYLILDRSILITNLEFSFLDQKIMLGNFSFPFTILCFMLFMNAFNMFDGINLQCGLYSLQIFIILYFATNNFLFIYLIIPISFFLILNYLNLCFLGNNGTSVISFTISVLIIKIYNLDKTFFADDIFIIMCIPGFDLLRLAIIRVLNKKHPFYPDRNHLHHLFLKNFKDLETIILIQIIILIPILLNFFTPIPFILLILITLITYILITFKYKHN